MKYKKYLRLDHEWLNRKVDDMLVNHTEFATGCQISKQLASLIFAGKVNVGMNHILSIATFLKMDWKDMKYVISKKEVEP